MAEVLSVGLLAAALGCGGSNQVDGMTPTVRDSSGVRIIEFSVDASPGSRFVLSDQPFMAAPGADSTFDLYRVADAVPLADGTIALANAGNHEILIVDSAGRLVRRLGHEGSGPGEFATLGWLAIRAPDTLLAGDSRLARITVFAPDGKVARVLNTNSAVAGRIATGEFAPQSIGGFADGRLGMASYGSMPLVAGPVRREMSLTVYDPTTETYEARGSWPGDELYLLPEDGVMQVLTPPFARSTAVSIGRQAFAVGDNENAEVRLFSETGSLKAVIRWKGARAFVTPELLEAEIRYRFRTLPDGPALEQRLAEQSRIWTHENMPAFGSLKLASDGRVWIARYAVLEDSATRCYGVDIEAGIVTELDVPRNAEVMHFGATDVLLLLRDEFEQERIGWYRMSSED